MTNENHPLRFMKVKHDHWSSTIHYLFRQQLHGISAWKSVSQLRAEGIFSLYRFICSYIVKSFNDEWNWFLFVFRGILPPLLQKSVSTSLMFGTFEQFKRILIERQVELSCQMFNLHISFDIHGETLGHSTEEKCEKRFFNGSPIPKLCSIKSKSCQYQLVLL